MKKQLFIQALKGFEENQTKRNIAAKEKIAAEQESKKRAEEKRKLGTMEDLTYARKIFRWVNKFKNSPEGKEALSIKANNTIGRTELLKFFEWHPGWGYNMSMTIQGNKIRLYRFGPGGEDWYSSTPEQLARDAQDVPAGMLKACCEIIKTGGVFDWIAKDLEFFTRKEE